MYLDHYQLKLKPFEIGPDPQFLWLGEKHQEAFAVLKYGILENKGFIVLIGEPGTGKSTLLNAIVGSFVRSIRFAKIADPALSEMDFFNFVANAFEMGRTFDRKADFLIHLQHFVSDAAARSEKVVLVIDEAQRLAPELLEQIRILANFEGPGQKVISCIFAGQSEFVDMVKQNPAMSQRVFFSHIIQPLTESETGDYIAHRLKVAGAAEAIFSASAVREVFRLSGGNPRLINVLCDQALLNGYAAHLKTIGANIIRECAHDTLIPRAIPTEPPALPAAAETSNPAPPIEELAETSRDLSQAAARESRRGPLSFKPAYGVAIALVAALGIVGFQFFSSGFRASSPDAATVSADAKELKTAREQVSQLEAALSDREQKHLQLEKHVKDLEKDVAQEKNSKEKLRVELSSREAMVAEMRKTLETFKTSQEKLEAEIKNAQNDKAGLESQVQELKAQRPATPPPSPPPRAQAAASAQAGSAGKPEASPDPADIIDFVIKKKSR